MFNFSNDLIQTLATILPIIAATLVILLVGANLLIKIRRKFNIKVNCWFCNQWTKVPYDNRNSFNCPSCRQYNGFDEWGGYNKEIPEQHDEFLNARSPQTTKRNRKPSSNGLCRLCNNNQQLKVYQLANFVPMNDENYDVEIEHFGKQLENAYKLCTECDNKLKQTLITQHKWILGLKIIQLKQQGLNTLRSLEKSTKRIRDEVRHQCASSYFLTFLHVLVISFASLILVNALYSAGIFEKTTLDLIHSYYVSLKHVLFQVCDAVYSFPSYLNNLKTEYGYILRSIMDFTLNLFSKSLFQYDFSSNISEDVSRALNMSHIDHLTLSICGFVLQVIISTFTNRKTLKYGSLVLWSLLVILSWHSFEGVAILYSAQVFATLILIYTIFTENRYKNVEIDNPSSNVWNNMSSLQNLLLRTQLESEMSLNSTNSKSPEKDTAESDCSFESITSKSAMRTSFNTCLPHKNIFNTSHSEPNMFNGPPVFRNVLTSSPIVFKSTVSEPTGFMKINSNRSVLSEISASKKYGIENYLNNSMDNLHIGSKMRPNVFKPIQVHHLSVNRPLISPPRLKVNNFNNTSHWNVKNFANVRSRSSSQSSGFVSQAPFTTSSPNNSICSDFDYASLFSEPLMQKRNFSDYGINEFNFSLSKQISDPA